MKQLLLLIVLQITCHITKAQEAVTEKISSRLFFNATAQAPSFNNTDLHFPNDEYEMYNRRSRTMRVTGLSLLGVGLISGVTALLIATNNDSNRSYEAIDRDDRTSTTLFVVSAATGIASIPFMILAHANKSKAKAALKTQGAYIPGKGTIPVTGVSLAISIGR